MEKNQWIAEAEWNCANCGTLNKAQMYILAETAEEYVNVLRRIILICRGYDDLGLPCLSPQPMFTALTPNGFAGLGG